MKNKSAILFGNGLNLLSKKNVSWDELLKGLTDVDELHKMHSSSIKTLKSEEK